MLRALIGRFRRPRPADSAARPSGGRTPHWHHIYFVLAAFDLFTVLLSLGLNHMVRERFADSVQVNRAWGDRLNRYSDLGELAGAVNAPGNDVFDSIDVPLERARLLTALQRFGSETSAIRADLLAEPERPADLLASLDSVEERMQLMVDEAQLIFAFFERNEPEAAGRRMATMDRRYADLNESLATLRRQVSDIQRGHLVDQEEAANQIARLEYIVGAMIVGMVIAAASYGKRMAQQVERETAARRLAELRAAEEQERRIAEARFRSMVGNTSDIIAVVGDDGVVTFASAATARVLGVAEGELAGRPLVEIAHPDDSAALRDALAQARDAAGAIVSTDVKLRRHDDTWRDAELIVSNAGDAPGIDGVVVTIRDVTERKRFERELSRLAFYDTLSGLPNRALFLDRLDHAITRAARYGSHVGVLFIDLDNFKVVNDSLGHEAGDELLVAVGQRASACVRRGDTLARLGGDEFTILLEDLPSQEEAIRVVDRIIKSLTRPFALGGRQVFVSASIGVATTLTGGDTPDALIRNADLAMYRAKTNGRAGYALFDPSMNEAIVERLDLETDLRQALERDEFAVLYQPIIDLESDRVVEVEALVRWNHPTRGLVTPSTFIPVAEDTGMIVPLGNWVLETACRDLTVWMRQYGDLAPAAVSVNLSAKQFLHLGLVDDITRVIASTGVDPARVKLEITESALMHDADSAAATLRRLRAMGLRIAVDDFGTGYSSLSYLSRFPVDTLKIDRSFISGLERDSNDASIVRSVVAMAKSLDLSITGEGIETPEQLAYLRSLGCHLGQGYYFSNPVSVESISSMLAAPDTAADQIA